MPASQPGLVACSTDQCRQHSRSMHAAAANAGDRCRSLRSDAARPPLAARVFFPRPPTHHCTTAPAAMKLPKYEGNDIQEASAQFTALMKEAEALVASSQTRITEIQVRCAGGRWGCQRRCPVCGWLLVNAARC